MTNDQSDQLLNILVAQLDILNRIARALQTIAAGETCAGQSSTDTPTPATSAAQWIGDRNAKP